MKRKNGIIKIFSLVFGIWCLVLSGCGRVALYNDLTQEDANKVMVLLQQNGIEATLNQEVKQNEVFWSIQVDQAMLAKGRELIVSGNVISAKAPGLKEVYQGKGSSGWIRSPSEERARYLLALKGEIINSLKKLPEVVDVDVVLNVPQEEELGSATKKRPTASVVIKAQVPPHGEEALNEMKVQEFVANAVEGMSARDVSVMIHFIAPTGTTIRPGETVTLPKPGLTNNTTPEAQLAATPVRLMGLKLDNDSRERLKVYLIIFFVVLMVLSVGLIIAIIQSSRVRQELKTLKSGEGHQALEGQVMEGGSPPKLRSGTREGTPQG